MTKEQIIDCVPIWILYVIGLILLCLIISDVVALGEENHARYQAYKDRKIAMPAKAVRVHGFDMEIGAYYIVEYGEYNTFNGGPESCGILENVNDRVIALHDIGRGFDVFAETGERKQIPIASIRNVTAIDMPLDPVERFFR